MPVSCDLAVFAVVLASRARCVSRVPETSWRGLVLGDDINRIFMSLANSLTASSGTEVRQIALIKVR